MELTPILPTGAPLSALERFLPSEAGSAPLIAVAAALRGFNREQIGSAIEVQIAVLNIRDGDADAEPATWPEDLKARESETISDLSDDSEHDGTDQGDQAWIEWHATHPATRGQCQTAGHEDGEEDDDPAQCSEDEISTELWATQLTLPGCKISDPDFGIDDERCDDIGQDLEREQMHDDVPMLPVFTLDHNLFNDKRTYLGRSNLQTSFQANGGAEISADSGRPLMPKDRADQPGVPV